MINIKDTLVENLIRCSVIDDYNKQDIIDDIDNAIEYEDSTLEYLNMFLCEDTNRHIQIRVKCKNTIIPTAL